MEDEKYEELREWLKNRGEAVQEYIDWAKQFEERNGQVFFEEKRVIPRREVTQIISMFHDDPTMAHQNKDIVLQHIRQRYIWKTMYRDVEEYVKTY